LVWGVRQGGAGESRRGKTKKPNVGHVLHKVTITGRQWDTWEPGGQTRKINNRTFWLSRTICAIGCTFIGHYWFSSPLFLKAVGGEVDSFQGCEKGKSLWLGLNFNTVTPVYKGRKPFRKARQVFLLLMWFLYSETAAYER
jgi:hypothetical protein